MVSLSNSISFFLNLPNKFLYSIIAPFSLIPIIFPSLIEPELLNVTESPISNFTSLVTEDFTFTFVDFKPHTSLLILSFLPLLLR